jgi:hypothetical protein
VGFGRVKNFNAAARKYLGLTPTAVKALSPAAYERLRDEKLQVDVAVLAFRTSQRERERERERERDPPCPIDFCAQCAHT